MALAAALCAPALGGATSASDDGTDVRSVVPDAKSCAALAGRLAPVLDVTEAQYVSAGETTVKLPAGGGRYREVTTTVPDHCVVAGEFEKRTGADGKPYAFKVEMRLPDDWNGRLLFQGGGGMNGTVRPATGDVMVSSTAPSGLARGFAVISTDSGHDAAITPGASFARDQLAMLNYAYASIGKVARVGEQITDAYYGAEPQRTYYWGCSNGGREALIAAQRYPEEFDGIIAMNPAFEISRAAMLAHYSTQTYHALGRPGEPGALTLEDWQLTGRAVTKQCDGLDGREDGLIFNHAACRFDPQVLQCKRGENNGCLSSAKVGALKRGFAGPLGSDGKPAMGSWVWDAGIAAPGWMDWQTGRYDPATGKVFGYFPSLVRDSMANYFSYPPVDEAELAGLDHSRVPDQMKAVAAFTDANSTQFSTFADRGGKMIVMTGWSDPIFSASDLTKWYEKLGRDTAATGGNAASFSRLFMNPGMNHCSGGPALDDMDLLGALDDWVEGGKAPASIIAKGKFLPGETRPLCQYPAYAHYSGSGDPAKASSYSCRKPAAK